jgi:hypothetical protein
LTIVYLPTRSGVGEFCMPPRGATISELGEFTISRSVPKAGRRGAIESIQNSAGKNAGDHVIKHNSEASF